MFHIRNQWESHRITFSNRFVEYIAAGIPIVGTPQELAKNINDKYNCCLFYNENDNTLLRNSLIKVLNNLAEFTEKAKKAKSDLKWEIEAKKLIDLYKKLAFEN